MTAKLDDTPRFRTLGDLAREVGTTPQQADYIIRTRRIRHSARAGTLRLFDPDAVQRVRVEIKLMADRKGGGRG